MGLRLRTASVGIALVALLALAAGGVGTGCSSCSKPSSSAEPVATPAADAAPHGRQVSSLRQPQRPKHDPPPVPADAYVPPQPKALPTWVLDADDPAHDYVDRYVRSTYRYGPQTTCVVIGKSSFDGSKTTVVVSNDASGSCGHAGDARDTFEVNVGADRLSLVDASHHDPLKKWPDGSDPEGPPGMAVEADARGWKGPLHDALTGMELVPVRLQYYGRGTYPVITIAGWHGQLARDTPADTLADITHRFCPANDNRPFAIFAGIDRANILRFDCPDKVRWELL